MIFKTLRKGDLFAEEFKIYAHRHFVLLGI